MNYLPEGGYRRILVVLAYIACGAVIIYFGVKYVAGLVLPFIVAWLIALAVQPLINKINAKTRISKKFLGVVFVLILLCLGGMIVFLIADRILYELRSFVVSFNSNYDVIVDRVIGFIDGINDKIRLPSSFDSKYLSGIISDIIKNTVTGISARLPNIIKTVIALLPETLLTSVIFILASFYTCVDFAKINGFIRAQLPEKAVSVISYLKASFISTGGKYVRAYLCVLVITFIELLCGFLIIGVDYALTLAIVIAAFDILPVVGAGTVLIPWAAVTLISGNYYTGFSLLILYAIVTVIRQIIEPKIVGMSLGLYPLATLFAMYVGFRLAGFAGLIVLPIVFILLRDLSDSGTLRLYKSTAPGKP